MNLQDIMNTIEYDFGFVPAEFGTNKTPNDFSTSELKEMYMSFLNEQLNSEVNEEFDEDVLMLIEELKKVS